MSPPAALALGAEAARRNVPFMFGMGAPFIPLAFGEPLGQVLEYADVVFMNETEGASWAEGTGKAPKEDLRKIAQTIAGLPKKNEQRKRLVVITQGTDPTLVAEGGEGEVKEFPVHAIDPKEINDTNGAGDAFAGGFLAGFVEGKELKTCVDMGMWLAAKSLRELGPQYVRSSFTSVHSSSIRHSHSRRGFVSPHCLDWDILSLRYEGVDVLTDSIKSEKTSKRKSKTQAKRQFEAASPHYRRQSQRSPLNLLRIFVRCIAHRYTLTTLLTDIHTPSRHIPHENDFSHETPTAQGSTSAHQQHLACIRKSITQRLLIDFQQWLAWRRRYHDSAKSAGLVASQSCIIVDIGMKYLTVSKHHCSIVILPFMSTSVLWRAADLTA